MAKYGYLFLNKGLWEDQQIIPAQWVEDSTKEHFQGKMGSESLKVNAPIQPCGYYWWIFRDGLYATLGIYGQYIIVYPRYNMVVVIHCGFEENSKWGYPMFLMKKYIIPSVIK